MTKNYHVGDCFNTTTYGENWEYIVVNVKDGRAVRDYGTYGVQTNKHGLPRIKQGYMSQDYMLNISPKTDVVRLHWMTFDEVTDMLLSIKDTARILGHVERVEMESEMYYLFIKSNNIIILISTFRTSRMTSDFSFKYVYVKNITEEEFNEIVKDRKVDFVPGFNGPCRPVRVEDREIFDYTENSAPDPEVRICGVIIGNDYSLLDYNYWHRRNTNRIMQGLTIKPGFWRDYRKMYGHNEWAI